MSTIQSLIRGLRLTAGRYALNAARPSISLWPAMSLDVGAMPHVESPPHQAIAACAAGTLACSLMPNLPTSETKNSPSYGPGPRLGGTQPQEGPPSNERPEPLAVQRTGPM